jgi:hypothetical protein
MVSKVFTARNTRWLGYVLFGLAIGAFGGRLWMIVLRFIVLGAAAEILVRTEPQ